MTALASIHYAKPLQHDWELEQLIELLRKEVPRSYLEIGARYGGSFERIMNALPLGTRGVAVDFPGGPFGDDGSPEILLSTMRRLKRDGRDVHCVFGPSGAPEVLSRVDDYGSYDVTLIDGDHRYHAVKSDYLNYRSITDRILILHDIAAPEGTKSHDGFDVEVPVLWKEIKGNHRSLEIVQPGSLMGFGVLFMEN